MFVSPELLTLPSNMTPVMNIGSESVVLIPSDHPILDVLAEHKDIGMLAISDDDWDMLAVDLNLPDYIAGVNESYFADRCKIAEKEINTCISRQGYASIYDDRLEVGFTAMDSIKRIPSIIRTYHEDTVDALLTAANFDRSGLTEREMMAAAIGTIIDNSDTNYDRHYEVDGVTMILYTAHDALVPRQAA